MTSYGAYTLIHANSSLIHYTGDWNLTSYMPISDGATASLNFTGSGVGILASGYLGLSTADGLLTSVLDASSDAPSNASLASGPLSSNFVGLLQTKLPPGAHTVDMIVDGTGLNFTFEGFSMLTNYTAPPSSDVTGVVIRAAQNVTSPVDWYEAGNTRSESNDGRENATVTYVQGPGSGFAFNFTGAGVAVWGPQNATADVDFAVYFNTSSPPSDDTTKPFDRLTIRKGTSGVIFYAGALPFGQHRILFVNQGEEKLGYEMATAYFPQFGTVATRACYVGCDDKGQLAGTEFGGALRARWRWALMCLCLVAVMTHVM